MRLNPAVLTTTALVVGFAHADTIHVPADYQDVPDAVDAAQAGDVILIQPGEYDICPGVTIAVNDLTIRGATDDPADVILLGGGAVSPIVANQRTGILFRAVTITDCATAATIGRSQVDFERCHIVDNISGGSGYTIACIDAAVTLDDCLVARNNARVSGVSAAVSAYAGTLSITGCRFEQNTAPRGDTQPITFGAAVFAGAALDMNNQWAGAVATIRDTVFFRNSSDLGAAVISTGGTLDVDRCRFAGNEATFGGAILVRESTAGGLPGVAEITNSLFDSNRAVRVGTLNGFGGAIASTGPNFVTTVNNTLHANTAAAVAPAVYVSPDAAETTFANNLLTDHASMAVDIPGAATAANNLDTTSAAAGITDPIGPDNEPGTLDEDFSLLPGSHAIDAGDNTLVPPGSLADLAGLPRFADDPATPDTGVGPAPIIDLGALEFAPEGPCNPADLAEPFGTLDLADITAFITGFNTMDPAADLNADGLFDLADIAAFVTAFNAGCP